TLFQDRGDRRYGIFRVTDADVCSKLGNEQPGLITQYCKELHFCSAAGRSKPDRYARSPRRRVDAGELRPHDDQRYRLAERPVAESGWTTQSQPVLDHSKLPVACATPCASSELESDCEKSGKRHGEDRAQHRFCGGSGNGAAAKDRSKAAGIPVVERRRQFDG